MKSCFAHNARDGKVLAAGLLLLCHAGAWATDWPQYRGPTTDGISPDAISTNWLAISPTVVWTNMSLTNGFSSFAVSQGRAFTLISTTIGGQLMEVCVAVDAASGTNIWVSPIGVAPGDPPDSIGNGGDGTSPYNTGDGPRSTPAVTDTNVIVLSGHMVLASLNVADGSTNWMKDLKALYGASEVNSGWNNAASPRLDDDLIFVNLNTSTNNLTLYAFRTTDGSWAWRSQNEKLTHTTPVVATILGTPQVLFATVTGIVSLDRNTGTRLWKYTYPWSPIGTSMAASPVVHSNIVFCTAAYNRGSAAVRINFTNGTWYATNQLWKQTYPDTTYQSIWMTPVAYQGYLYGQFAYASYLTCPLNCLEMASGNLMWSTPGFGKGGTILVNRYILSLTEDGQLVLVNPAPSGYVELARFQAFHFSETNHGKCWNSPAYSNGRIYARSTRGGICVDVSVPAPPPLKLLCPQFLSSTQLKLVVSTVNGTPIDSNRLAAIRIHSAARLPASAWSRLTNSLVLTNGSIEVNLEPSAPQRYLIAVEPPGSLGVLVQSLQQLPGGLRLHVSSADGYPIAPSRLAGIEILSTTGLLTTVTGWSCLTNNLTLTNGVIEVILEPSGRQRYFIATEQP